MVRNTFSASANTNTKTFASYSGYETVQAKYYEPASIEKLQAIVRYCNENSRTFSMSGSCLSFDSQCLNPEMIISTKRINHIHLNLEQNRITVGSGATWGSILSTILPLGYGTYINPTAGEITVGGSISCDSYTRFTPGFGRESRWVRSLKVLTTEGAILHCDPTTNSDLFYGVLGGLGIVAIVCEVEFEVHCVGESPAIRTVGCFEDGFSCLDYVKPEKQLPGYENSAMIGAGLVIYKHQGEYRTLITKYRWENTSERKATLMHQRSGFMRIAGGVLLRVLPQLVSIMWNAARHKADREPNKQDIAVDNPEDMLLFMDADRKSKKIADRLGINTNILQQSFIIPCFDEEEESASNVTAFADYCLAALDREGVIPAMVDVGFLPKGDKNAFNLNPNQSAYMFSIAIEGKAIISQELIQKLFEDFSLVCHRYFQGKIHPTKNIFCSKELLHTMYAAELDHLLRLKSQYDPKGLLQTLFFHEHFGILRNNIAQEQALPEGVSPA